MTHIVRGKTTKPTKEQIRQLRKALGLSRSTFGAITYVTERAVIAWEYGERQMGELYWEKYLLHYNKQEP